MEKTKDILNVFNSKHEPYWIDSTPDTNYPQIDKDINVDVAIVGGGITGITSAFLLKNEGLKVAVIEANKILKGTTGHTTAKITSQHDLIYDRLIKSFGKEKAQQYADANQSAIRMIESLVEKYNIDCDFYPKSAYVYTQSDEYIDKIENEVRAASSLGIKASYQQEIGLPFQIKAAVRFDDQAQFHPRKYLLRLAEKIPGAGSYIFEGTKATNIEDDESRSVVCNNVFRVTASKIIIATHFPFYDGLGFYFARMYAEKSYALVVKIKEKFPEGMFINAEEPGRSLRCQKYNGSEIVIVGGEHHKTAHEKYTNKRYENLGEFAREIFNVESFLYRWSTQDCMTLDDIPYVGHLTSKTPNIYVATGFGKWGMTNGTASAMILKDLILTGKSSWADVYDPSRFNPVESIPNLVSQNLDVAEKLIGGKIAPVPENIEIKNGEAKVIRKDGSRVGAYRDERGILHIVDITCTHLGCELVWNEAEKTWDCPCHGSRFSYDGAVVEGPAFNELKHAGEGENKKDANIIKE